MLRWRLSTVRTVSGHDGVFWTVRRNASLGSLRLANHVRSDSYETCRVEITESVEGIKSLTDEWQSDTRLRTRHNCSRLSSSCHLILESCCARPSRPRGTLRTAPISGSVFLQREDDVLRANDDNLSTDTLDRQGEVTTPIPRSLTAHVSPALAVSAPAASSSALDLLRYFLSRQNIMSPDPHIHTANSLKSFYLSIKHRSQLVQLTSAETSALIRLLGSLSIGNFHKGSVKGIFMHPFTSKMGKSSFRNHWSFVVQIAKDKRSLDKNLSNSDHYWLMRANLAILCSLKLEGGSPVKLESFDTSIVRRARRHYLHISEYYLLPDVHAPYIDTLFLLGDPGLLKEAATRLCGLLTRVDEVHPRLLEMLWILVLQHGSSLPANLKRLVLSCVGNRLHRYRSRLSSDESDTSPVSDVRLYVQNMSASDLVSAMTAILFPSSSFPRTLRLGRQDHQWLITQAETSLCPDDGIEVVSSHWSNLVLLALVNASSEAVGAFRGDIAGPMEQPGAVETIDWQVICGLGILQKACDSSSLHDSSSRDGISEILWTFWRRWSSQTTQKDPKPSTVVHAIVAGFLRLSGSIADSSLKDACYHFCASVGLWSNIPSKASYESGAESILVEYAAATILCGADRWEHIFANMSHLPFDAQFRSTIASKAMLRIVRVDVAVAYRLYSQSESVHIHFCPDVTRALAVAVASRGAVHIALSLLAETQLSNEQSHDILGAVLIQLTQSNSFRMPLPLAMSVSDSLIKLYSHSAPPSTFRGRVQHTLLALSRSGLAQKAYMLFETIYRWSPSYFSGSFISRMLHSLLSHRHFVLAVRLFQLVHEGQPELAMVLHHRLLLGLYRGRASRLAHTTSRSYGLTQRNVPFSIFMARATEFGRMLSSRISGLKITRPSNTTKLSGVPDIRLALDILVRAGRPRAAQKLYKVSHPVLSQDERTSLGNIVLHGNLLRLKNRNARQMQKLLSSLDRLVKDSNFVPDRVTANIIVKAILRWKRAVTSQHAQALFDTLIRSGYPAGKHGTRAQGVFGTAPYSFPHNLPLVKLRAQMSFRRHVRPLYRMFIKAFFTRGDERAAKTVVRVLKDVESDWMERTAIREKARMRGRARAKIRSAHSGQTSHT